MENPPKSTSGSAPEDVSTRLSRQRTTLSFQRTRLSADRTLMSVIRTALSLIGFGFTIFQFFRSLKEIIKVNLKKDPSEIAGQLGLALVSLGILMLFLGIVYHISFMLQVRKERGKMETDHLIMSGDTFPISMTLIIAILLFLLGVYIIFKMITHYY
ncbi:YidH family protein [Adhaeribacter terreus]|uniref:YidH family protein n=1 Tax=Adhaeribacter terreus TaxID=529703 RepID=A0ABW0EE50_9BACT